jgi:hypothetical protein
MPEHGPTRDGVLRCVEGADTGTQHDTANLTCLFVSYLDLFV